MQHHGNYGWQFARTGFYPVSASTCELKEKRLRLLEALTHWLHLKPWNEWTSLSCKLIPFSWEKSLRRRHSSADVLCSAGSTLFMTPKSNGCCFVLPFAFFFFFFQTGPVFKNTSKWQALKQVQSDQAVFWGGSMWVKATCDMNAQQEIIRCSYWMSSYIYFF